MVLSSSKPLPLINSLKSLWLMGIKSSFEAIRFSFTISDILLQFIIFYIRMEKKYNKMELNRMNMTQLRALAKEYNLKGYSRLRKDELTKLINESNKDKGSKGPAGAQAEPENQLIKSNKMELNRLNMSELKALAKEYKLKGYSRLRKDGLIELINESSKGESKEQHKEVTKKNNKPLMEALTKRQCKRNGQKLLSYQRNQRT